MALLRSCSVFYSLNNTFSNEFESGYFKLCFIFSGRPNITLDKPKSSEMLCIMEGSCKCLNVKLITARDF